MCLSVYLCHEHGASWARRYLSLFPELCRDVKQCPALHILKLYIFKLETWGLEGFCFCFFVTVRCMCVCLFVCCTGKILYITTLVASFLSAVFLKTDKGRHLWCGLSVWERRACAVWYRKAYWCLHVYTDLAIMIRQENNISGLHFGRPIRK